MRVYGETERALGVTSMPQHTLHRYGGVQRTVEASEYALPFVDDVPAVKGGGICCIFNLQRGLVPKIW